MMKNLIRLSLCFGVGFLFSICVSCTGYHDAFLQYKLNKENQTFVVDTLWNYKGYFSNLKISTDHGSYYLNYITKEKDVKINSFKDVLQHGMILSEANYYESSLNPFFYDSLFYEMSGQSMFGNSMQEKTEIHGDFLYVVMSGGMYEGLSSSRFGAKEFDRVKVIGVLYLLNYPSVKKGEDD